MFPIGGPVKFGFGSNHRYSVVIYSFHSRALEKNPLGDPADRLLIVLLPPGYQGGQAYPQVWMLSGFGGTGRSFLNFNPFGEDLLERVNRLHAEGRLGPMVFVLPDTFTGLGGNQHISSPGVGDYETYLWDELLPFVEERHPSAGARAVAGQSSGGYGALVNAMRHPGLFEAVVCHSGDMGFELCYWPDIGHLLREVARAGGLPAFRRLVLGCRFGPSSPSPSLRAAINLFAMAATYSPSAKSTGLAESARQADPAAPNGNDDDAGVELPVDLNTGELLPGVWQRWLAHDPVRMVTDVPGAAGALRHLKLLFFDCGEEDEFNLLFGARRLDRRLTELGIPHLFETFPGGHFHTSHRYDRSLPLIWEALKTR